MHVFGNGRGSRVDVQLFVNTANVSAQSSNADLQLVRRLLIRQALGQAIKDRLFAR